MMENYMVSELGGLQSAALDPHTARFALEIDPIAGPMLAYMAYQQGVWRAVIAVAEALERDLPDFDRTTFLTRIMGRGA